MTDLSDRTVLVVDDTETNLDVLVETLGEHFEVSVATDGESALELAAAHPPDLILLDIMMPGMNGFEVCEHLKKTPELASIPVLFISALTDAVDKLKGFEVGGLDYIAKPFNPREVLARVTTHLELARARETLETQHAELQSSYERLRELEELRDSLTHMVVHDMRAPLTGAMGYVGILQMDPGKGPPIPVQEMLEQTEACLHNLNDMMNTLLDVSRLESGEMPLDIQNCDLERACRKAVKNMGAIPEQKAIRVKHADPAVVVQGDPEIIRRTVQNLLSNAVRFSPNGGEVVVSLESSSGAGWVHVRDHGPGVPPEFRDKIFEKFGQVEGRRHGEVHTVGLGLAFCKLAVEAHGGSISVDNSEGGGSVFSFATPLAPHA